MSTKPKTLLYRDALADAERRIVDALPAIVDGLIARAKGATRRRRPTCSTASWAGPPR